VYLLAALRRLKIILNILVISCKIRRWEALLDGLCESGISIGESDLQNIKASLGYLKLEV